MEIILIISGMDIYSFNSFNKYLLSRVCIHRYSHLETQDADRDY